MRLGSCASDHATRSACPLPRNQDGWCADSTFQSPTHVQMVPWRGLPTISNASNSPKELHVEHPVGTNVFVEMARSTSAPVVTPSTCRDSPIRQSANKHLEYFHGKGRGQERGCCAACRILLLGHTTVSLLLAGRRPPVWTSTELPTDRQPAMECLSSHTKALRSSHAGSGVTRALRSSSVIAGKDTE